MVKVKRLSKYFLVFALMFVTMLGSFGLSLGAKHTASATFEDTKSNTLKFQNTAMFMEYAGNTLVGLDNNGNYYKMKNGSFDKTGYQFKIKLLSIVGSNNSCFRGTNTLIAYESGVLVVAGSDGENTIMYYSTDEGETWFNTTIGTKSTTGYPISIQATNGYFGLITAKQNSSGDYTSGNMVRSTNGKDWEITTNNVSIDYSFSASNGYFFRTQYSETETPVIYYSLDLQNWTSFLSPIDIKVSTGDGYLTYSNPDIAIAYVNNAYYLFGWGETYLSTNLSTWKRIYTNDLFSGVYKAVPYQNGLVLCSRDYIWYVDIDAYGITNIKTIASGTDTSLSIYETAPFSMLGNTVVESENELCVGFNGFYGIQRESQYALAHFEIYEKAIKHEVKFIDYNGTVLSTVKVVEGQTVVAPQNPARIGYTFTGWDKDITQPITEETTFTAQYTINTYSVKFVDYNGQVLKTISITYGETIESSDIPKPTREGYTFTGWDKDITQPITAEITFIANYLSDVRLTIRYPGIVGTSGLDGQFLKTEIVEKEIPYILNSQTKNEEYLNFYNETLSPWIKDFDDGTYNYTTRFLGWDKELPTTMTEDFVIEAQFEELHLVTLKYYSQVRFPYGNTAYYYPCIVYVQKETLLPKGTSFKLEDFKLNYFEYEDYEGKRPFYDNLYNFEFLGWDKEFETVSKDTTYTGIYKMPQVHLYYYDSDFYLVEERDIDITFIPIEDIQKVDGWSRFVNAMENFFSLRWGELIEDVNEMMNFDEYVENISGYSKASSRVLMPFVIPDVKILAYNGLFTNSNCSINSKNLAYVDGDYTNNDMRYFVDTVAFSNNLEKLTASVEYDTLLDSAYKTGDSFFDKVMGSLDNVFEETGTFFKENWKIILIVIVGGIGVVVLIKWIKTGFKTNYSSNNNYRNYNNKKHKNKKRR